MERLLPDERLGFEGISGASSGAINASIMACGFAKGGREGARDVLKKFWEVLSSQNLFFPAALPRLQSSVDLTSLFC